jgi:hypothetical protein
MQMKRIALGLWMASLMAAALSANAQIPQLIEKNGRHQLLVDGKPYFILGGQAHNSSAWPATLPSVWSSIRQMHANTLEVPLYWEQIEPTQGQYDYSLLDTLLIEAKNQRVRLVLLWFGTWKNGSNHYMPTWMKKDSGKYPNITGINGKPVDSPSPFSESALAADKAVFSGVMRHLKLSDPQHTVIMVQVENEPGTWGSVRDYSTTAQKLFEGPVPEALRSFSAYAAQAGAGASWKEAFGDRADEYFHAWYVARYIDQVSAAGKQAYNLPLYVNVALRDPLSNPPATNYESGGATDNVILIWKIAAPNIDLLAPDIYLDGHKTILKIMDLYTRPDNALFVPEGPLGKERVKYLYAVLAHGGIGFSPFGIDDNGGRIPSEFVSAQLRPFGQEYAALEPMLPQLAQWSYEGKIQAATETEDHQPQLLQLGAWQANISFGLGERDVLQPNDPPTGSVMIVSLEKNKFLIVGTRCHITFLPLGADAGKPWQYLKVEEGAFVHGAFHARRILNGDETDWGGPAFGERTSVLQVELITR